MSKTVILLIFSIILATGSSCPGLTISTDGHYGLHHAESVAPLVKAVQEQQAIIEDLKLKIEELIIQNEKIIKRIEALEGKKY